jgi:tetratricopeptide (TPR) repeat protein
MTRTLHRQGAKTPRTIQFLFSVFLASSCLGVGFCGVAFGHEMYEFCGRVVDDEGHPFRRVAPIAFLHGATRPFSARALVDRSGQFKFKRLAPGMYTLIVGVPRAGTLTRTVEISSSFAAGGRRVDASFVLERKPSAADSNIVSASQLAVPEKAIAEYERAQERLGKEDVPRAIELLKNAVEIAPQYSAAWNNLGTIAYHSRQFAEAEEYFRTALRADADAYAPLVNLGGALLSLGKNEESLVVNLRAVKARPDDALAHSQLGRSYLALERLEDAEVHLKTAKTIDPAHFSFPQMALAEIYGRRRNYEAAALELEDLLRYHPDSESAGGISRTVDQLRARARGKEPAHSNPDR